MPTRQRFNRLLRTLFRRPETEEAMEAEMRLHIDLEAEELMAQGMSAEEARRQASLAFGGVQQRKEDALEEGSFWWIDDMRRDVRIATRTLVRHPTFAITATLALALAIAVNTTMFSVLDAMINPKIGAVHPEQLYNLRYFGNFGRRLGLSAPDQALADGGRTYSGYSAAASYFGGGTIERGELVRRAQMLVVQANFFAVLGVAPVEGTLTPNPDPGQAAASIIISDRLQTQLFQDGESPVGQSLDIDGASLRIIGVVRH
nr:permease prefix domain 1-containing protein [Gemmatimonadota bacterium]